MKYLDSSGRSHTQSIIGSTGNGTVDQVNNGMSVHNNHSLSSLRLFDLDIAHEEETTLMAEKTEQEETTTLLIAEESWVRSPRKIDCQILWNYLLQ